MPKRPHKENSWALAAATVAVAAAMGTPALAARQTGPADSDTVRNLQSYCQSSWRNAGINRQEWPDCTQQAVAELIEKISTERLVAAVSEKGSSERRELNRAVWRIIQRWRRSPQMARLSREPAGKVAPDDSVEWGEVAKAARDCLSGRQLKILEMIRDGWRVPEIAERLALTQARVSDEKYKAIRKLRRQLAIS